MPIEQIIKFKTLHKHMRKKKKKKKNLKKK